jgi:CRISPR-associated protein Cmr5
MPLHTRDQERARRAYEWATQAGAKKLEAAYKVRVNALGSNVLRCGLVAAIAFLERDREEDPATKLLLDQLAHAGIPGVDARDGRTLAVKIREMALNDYLLATREVLQLALWMRRAVQSTFPKTGGQTEGGDAQRSR